MEEFSIHAVPFEEPVYFGDNDEDDVPLIVSAHHSRETAAQRIRDYEFGMTGEVVTLSPESLERVTVYTEESDDGPIWEIAHSGRVPPQAERSCMVWLANLKRGYN